MSVTFIRPSSMTIESSDLRVFLTQSHSEVGLSSFATSSTMSSLTDGHSLGTLYFPPRVGGSVVRSLVVSIPGWTWLHGSRVISSAQQVFSLGWYCGLCVVDK